MLLLMVLIGGVVGTASAHDTETVDGYEVTFGGSDEPVITDERMWLEVNVVDTETEEPLAGLEDSLSIAVQEPFGNDTHELDVGSRFGEPGWYEAQVIFTEPGTYTVYVNGTINGSEASLEFQKQVHNADNLEYPAPSNQGGGSDEPMSGLIPGIAVGAAVTVVGMAIAFVAGRRFG